MTIEATTSKPVRILLVDDSPYFLATAIDYLNYQEEIEVVGTATDRRSALEQAQLLEPDVILLDLNLGGESGLDLIPLVKDKLPTAKIAMVTLMDEPLYRKIAIESGADAFVHKSAITTELIPTITDLMESASETPLVEADAGILDLNNSTTTNDQDHFRKLNDNKE